MFALIAAVVWFAVWGVAVLWLFSCGTPEPREKFEFITEIKWDDKVRYMFFYQVFGLFWMNAFIVGCCQFIIACAACKCSTRCRRRRQ